MCAYTGQQSLLAELLANFRNFIKQGGLGHMHTLVTRIQGHVPVVIGRHIRVLESASKVAGLCVSRVLATQMRATRPHIV